MSTLTMPPPVGIPTFPIQKISVARYHQMIERGVYSEDDKVELIEGYIVPKMSQKPPHGGTVQNVEKKILRRLPTGWTTRSQAPITLPDSEPEPDVVAAKGDEAAYFTRHPKAADIGLLIEVSESTLKSDRGEKKRVYARAGIPVYWIVNLADHLIEVYTQPSGPTESPDYAFRQDFARDDTIPLVLDGVVVASLPVSDLLPS